MNRQQRRQEQRLGTKEKTYTYTEREFNKIVAHAVKQYQDEIAKEVLVKAVQQYSAILVQALHESMDLGQKRIQKVLDKVQSIFDAVNKDAVTIEEIKAWVESEMKIKMS